MGANFDYMKLDGSLNKGQVIARFRSHQAVLAHESGSSYSGQLNMADGLEFDSNKVFENENQAHEYLQSKCQKWENAIAVRFKISGKIDLTDKKLIDLNKKMGDLKTNLNDLAFQLSEKTSKKLTDRPFISCIDCKSILSTRFRINTLLCPVCKSDFCSKSDKKKVETLKLKILKMEIILKDHYAKLQTKANKSVKGENWLIGAICSC